MDETQDQVNLTLKNFKGNAMHVSNSKPLRKYAARREEDN